MELNIPILVASLEYYLPNFTLGFVTQTLFGPISSCEWMHRCLRWESFLVEFVSDMLQVFLF